MNPALRLAGVLTLIGACAKGRPASAPEALPAPARAAPPLLGVPDDAAIVVSMDPATALAWIGALVPADLGLPSEPAALGIDPRRPITVAIAKLDANARPALEVLRTFETAPAETSLGRRIAILDAVSSPFPMRAIIPARDPKKLRAFLDGAARAMHFKPIAGGHAEGSSVVAVTSTDDSVVVDYGRRRLATEGTRALETELATAHAPPPPLDGFAMRATWAPGDVADLFSVTRALVATMAIPPGMVDEATRDGSVSEGAWDAARLLVLAGPPAFTRATFEMRRSPFEATLRMRAAHGGRLPPSSAWAPSVDCIVQGASVQVDVTRALRAAWPWPAGNLDALLRAGGPNAKLVGLPHTLLTGQALGIDPPAEIADRFERVVSSRVGDDAAFVGLLPAGASRATAECALASSACGASERLAPGVVQSRGRKGFAELVEIDHRYVVVEARHRTTLPLKLTLVTAGPWELHASPSLAGIPAHVDGTASAIDDEIVFTFR